MSAPVNVLILGVSETSFISRMLPTSYTVLSVFCIILLLGRNVFGPLSAEITINSSLFVSDLLMTGVNSLFVANLVDVLLLRIFSDSIFEALVIRVAVLGFLKIHGSLLACSTILPKSTLNENRQSLAGSLERKISLK